MKLGISRVVIAVAFVAGCKKTEPATPPADPKKPTPVVAPAPEVDAAVADPSAAWQEYAGTGFTIRAPHAPSVTTRDTDTAFGKVPTELYGAYAPEGSPGAMSVAVTRIPPAQAKQPGATILKAGRDGLVAKFSGTIDKEGSITVGGEVGLESVISGTHPKMGPFVVHWRGFIHKGALYQVQCLRDPSVADFGPLGDKFIESFAFKD